MMQTPSETHTILIIEDDEATLEFLDLFLSTSGYQVRTAGTGKDGLTLATAHSVEAILLDRRLPDMDGITACERLRNQIRSTVPIIMLTADRDVALESAAREAGATMFLRKPFDPDVLLQGLATVLRQI